MPRETDIGWVGKTRILKHTQFCVSILRVEETQQAQTTGSEGCSFVVWFGKYTDIASLVLLFGFTTPA